MNFGYTILFFFEVSYANVMYLSVLYSCPMEIIKVNMDVLRSIRLLSTQLTSLKIKTFHMREKMNQFCSSDFTMIQQIFIQVLHYGQQMIHKDYGINTNILQESKSITKEEIQQQIIKNIHDLEHILNVIQTKTNASKDVMIQESSKQLVVLMDYLRVTTNNGNAIKRGAINSSEKWTFIGDCNSLNESKEERPCLEIELTDIFDIVTLNVQGAIIPSSSTTSSSTSSSSTNKHNIHHSTTNIDYHKLIFPCGKSLSTCDSSIACTILLYSDLFNWEILIKKNSPEKFLQRPPVRFLYDLFCHFIISLKLPIFRHEQMEKLNWDIVSATKQSKMEFMDDVSCYIMCSI